MVECIFVERFTLSRVLSLYNLIFFLHKKLLDFIHPYEKPIYSVFCVMSKNIRLKNGEEKNPFLVLCFDF